MLKWVNALFILSIFVAFSVSVSAQPSSVCEGKASNPACQNPVFADNQDEYFFDRRGSSILNDGAPSTDSVTMLHGGLAGNLETNSSDIQSVPGR